MTLARCCYGMAILLPGTWLVTEAIEQGMERLESHPVDDHLYKTIGSYLLSWRVSQERHQKWLPGHDHELRSGDAHGGAVWGGRGAVNPQPDGIWFSHRWGSDSHRCQHLDHRQWLGATISIRGQDASWQLVAGQRWKSTDQPAALFADPPGTVLPLGGTEVGYKGFGLALMVEARTAALTGFGRADAPSGQGSPVFIQLIDPAAFGGRQGFERETGWLANACRSAKVRPGDPAVRLPGERALKLRAEQLDNGVELYPSIMPALSPCAEKLGVAAPLPL